jgi:hypothetical protein
MCSAKLIAKSYSQIEAASQPTLEEMLDRAGGRAGGSLTFKAAVRAERHAQWRARN